MFLDEMIFFERINAYPDRKVLTLTKVELKTNSDLVHPFYDKTNIDRSFIFQPDFIIVVLRIKYDTSQKKKIETFTFNW
jgi:hypothetical protein